MLALRALTAAVLLAAFAAALLLLERAWFAAMIGAVMALGAHEWGRLARLRRASCLAYAVTCAALYGALAWAWWPLEARTQPVLGLHVFAALFWGGAVPLWLARGAPGWLLPPAGLVVLVPAGLAAMSISPRLLLALLGLVWIGDTAAYLAGRAFGRRKLAPAISPGKTWEGVAGALLASLAYAIIVESAVPEIGERVGGPGWVLYLGGAGLLSAAGIAGDLLESAVKRGAGVKDSGALLPGHGGVLDRIDSATAVLPVGALLLAWMGAT